MKKIVLLMSFSLTLCHLFGQTQLELNNKANEDFLKADKELNSVYKAILKEYKTDTAFIENLKASQLLWIQFRDAEMLVKYPNREIGYYGSVQPICWSTYKTELTQDRISKLKQWLDGEEEGDVCAGTVKTKD
ncbi:MAG: DUF1311 domain-containing protein [Terrimonas sp.]|nr:DUF1311 domain-containing protein [Terrimonas sp.]